MIKKKRVSRKHLGKHSGKHTIKHTHLSTITNKNVLLNNINTNNKNNNNINNDDDNNNYIVSEVIDDNTYSHFKTLIKQSQFSGRCSF